MTLPFLHPRLGEIEAFARGDLKERRRRLIAAHCRRCFRCQDSLRFVKRLALEAAALPEPALPDGLFSRVLADRARGERAILAAATAAPRPRREPGRRVAGWGTAALALIAIAFLARTPDLGAVSDESEMVLTPGKPRLGDRIELSYRPAPGLFRGEDSLVLRARLRTARDDMYPGSVPSHQVRRVAALRRTADGSYRASFTLPDSIVFASLAVEDPGATHVDDHGGRLWEVMTFGPDGVPLYESLNQRVNDMMGRSWEEGYATARRLTELYPERISAWTLREFFERALYGDEGADSISAESRDRLRSLIEEAKHLPSLSEDDIGTFLYRSWAKILRGGSAADSVELAYWWERIQREYPRHSQVAQKGASDLAARYRGQPAVLLNSLEGAYSRLAPLEGPGNNLINVARWAATEAGDDQAYRRWTERAWTGSPDSARQVAFVLVRREPFRPEGMEVLRRLLSLPPESLRPGRGLTTTGHRYSQLVDADRRRVLAALGRALIAEGRTAAGLDTLTLAAEGVWDIGLFRDVAPARLAAGDTAGAHVLHARLAVDPRTLPATADSLATVARRSMGSRAWDSTTAVARQQLHAHQLDRATVRRLRGTPRLMTVEGRILTLSELAGKQPAVVIFWSRHCGAALEALPAIVATGERLRDAGTPVLMVLDETPSEGLAVFLTAKKVTLPVYHDVDGSTREAFTNFGTPQYFVLDAAGRIRFDRVDGEAELIAQVSALGGPDA